MFADQIAAFEAKTIEKLDRHTRMTVQAIGERLAVVLSPYGDPAFWSEGWREKRGPDYVGGHFASNWVYSVGQTTEKVVGAPGAPVGSLAVVDIDRMPAKAIGQKHYLQNSVPYGGALERGWSWRQAPDGIIQVIAYQLTDISDAVAREIAK